MYQLNLKGFARPYQGRQNSLLDVIQHIQINYIYQLGVLSCSSEVSRGVFCHTIDTHSHTHVNICLAIKTPLVVK